MKLSLTPDIGTRDGSLAKDAVATNLVAGQRRPGLGSLLWVGVAPSGAGVGQGILGAGTSDIKLVNKVLYFNSFTEIVGPPISFIPTPSLDLSSYLGNTSPCDLLLYYQSSGDLILIVGKNSSLVVVNQTSQAVSTPLSLSLAKGIALLDTTLYVMDLHGNIRGSDLGDITTWNALNTITVDLQGAADVAQVLLKYLNYVVAFTSYSVQFFYDNGNPVPGSPLSPALSMQLPLGTANAYTVAQFSAGIIFVSLTAEGQLGVHAIVGTTLGKVSSDAVDKFLTINSSGILLTDITAVSTSAYGAVTTMNGREVYLLYVQPAGVTLVYDIVEKVWGKLTVVTASSTVNGVPTYTEAPWDYIFAGYRPGYLTLQSVGTGDSAHLDAGTTATDSTLTQPIVVRVVTQPLFDSGTNTKTRIAATEVIGDKVSEVAYLSYTDDDYQTWSAWQQVDLSAVRSRLLRQGSTHRRSYRLQYSGNTKVRLRDLVLDIPERSEQ